MNIARIIPALTLVFVLLAVDSARATSAVVVNFDDLPEQLDLTASGYAGLIWENGNAGLNGNIGYWRTPSLTSNNYPHSLPHDIINAWGPTLIGIGFPEPVDVDGAYIAAQGDPSLWSTGVTVHAYFGGQLVESTAAFTDIGSTPEWFHMGFSNIDRIVFESAPLLYSAGGFGIDDLTYTPLPEPSALMLIAMLLTLGVRRRLTGPAIG